MAFLDVYKRQVLMDKLNIVQRNAVRLLNLVNQLLDFRKIDVNGYYLSLSDDDIISCIPVSYTHLKGSVIFGIYKPIYEKILFIIRLIGLTH